MKSNNKGFSLIEVIVALALFTIIFVSLMQLLDSTSKLQQRTKQRENMSAIAMNIYETFLLDGDKTNFKTNLKFIYGEEYIISYEEGFIIYFNGSWNPTDRDNHKYKAVINLTESTVNDEADDEYVLYEVNCKVSFNDKNGSELLVKTDIPTYIVKGGS